MGASLWQFLKAFKSLGFFLLVSSCITRVFRFCNVGSYKDLMSESMCEPITDPFITSNFHWL